jgi:putative ABC transport system permease protein
MRLILHNFLFVLKRFKTSSILNILGLAVAFAVFFISIVQTYYDFGYNRNFKNADNIYLYTLCRSSDVFRNKELSVQQLKEFADRHPEILNYCYIQKMWDSYAIHDSTGVPVNFIYNVPIILSREGAGESFVNVFKPKIIAGDAATAFIPGRAMLSESLAKKFFGNENPIGQVIYKSNTDIPITVAAVCKDFPENCSLGNGVYMLHKSDFSTGYGCRAYVETVSGGKKTILKKEVEKQQKDDSELQAELTALPEIPLIFPEEGGGNRGLTIVLLTIGILLIIIAYINFVNFSVAMAPIRLKGLNIRRIVGESAFLLRFSLIVESVFFSLLAFLLSILFVRYLNSGIVKEFLNADLSLSRNTGLLLSFAGCSLIMGLLAGIYPAFYSTAFQPAIALNNSFANSQGSKRIRNILITVQFVTVIFLVITAGFIKLQHIYMQNESWGINKENVVYMPYSHLKQNIKIFEEELRQNPDIIDITYSMTLPGFPGIANWDREYNSQYVNVSVWAVSHSFLHFFGIDVIEGNDFQPEDDYGPEKMIFNRAFVEKYGFDNINIIGTTFPGTNPSERAEIIGIAENINFEVLREPIKPMAFISCNHNSGMNCMLIKISGQNTLKTFDYIRNTVKKHAIIPEGQSTDIQFIDDMMNEYLYTQEKSLSKLISLFTLITIIIAIMGVYGLILFNVKLKRKTIALHKINGALVREVILMLNRGFVVPFAIAYFIAVPAAYIVISRWLENFAYKTSLHWWVFVGGGLFVFLIIALTVSRQSYKAATENPIEGIKME